MIIVEDEKYDYDDILLVPQRSIASSRKSVDLYKKYKFYHSTNEWGGTPIMVANMDTTGTFAMADSLGKEYVVTCLHKHYKNEDLEKHFCIFPEVEAISNNHSSWISIGMGENQDKIDLIKRIYEDTELMPNLCIDVANGYMQTFVEYCASVREKLGDKPIIMAGNVCTPEMTQELIIHGGVDIVKIGIGPGSACTTRLKTGVGYPQMSAVMECSQVAHGLKSADGRHGLICADGGCKTPADVCKAFAAGADFVMLGGLFAGVEECDGEWEHHMKYEFVTGPRSIFSSTFNMTKGRKKRLKFYGMSSEEAQNKHNGGMADYKASEGRVKYVDYKGLALDVVKEIKGGLASCCAYVGATSLKDLPKCAKAIKVRRTHYDQTM